MPCLPENPKPLGLYLHFPFCGSKCGYCDFLSWAGQQALKEPYTQRLIEEITSAGSRLGRPSISTVFLGGGTPTVMETQQMDRVLAAAHRHFDIRPQAEITCEANPASLGKDFARMLAGQGVNRLSLGVQSFLPHELKLLGRVHEPRDVEASVSLARQAGIQNINLDLMLGLPGQQSEHLSCSLERAILLQPQHLSCYSLIVEEGTALFDRVKRGYLTMPGQEEERELYWLAADTLKARGYSQYEISNFALPGKACRHNLDCWQYQDYLGLGLGASGFFEGKRSRNPDTLTGYLAGEGPHTEAVSAPDSRFEQVMLGLRTAEGLDLIAFQARQGISLPEAFPGALEKHISGGLLQLSDTHLRLTRKGFDLMDLALLDFLP